VAVADVAGNTITGATNPISITGIGTTLSGSTIGVPAVGGIATFNGVTVGSTPVTGCSISATAAGLTTVVSVNFNVLEYAGTGFDGSVSVVSGTFNINLANAQTGVTKSQVRTAADGWNSTVTAFPSSASATIADALPAGTFAAGDE